MKFSRHLPKVIACSLKHVQQPVLSVASRCFSSQINLLPDMDFDELKMKLEGKEVTLIDVRTPQERIELGIIPDSKNLMVQSLGPSILLPDDEFTEKLGFKKPNLEEPIVTHCMGGVRARTAQLAMIAVGYNNVRMYKGSFTDWLEKEGPVIYPEADDDH